MFYQRRFKLKDVNGTTTCNSLSNVESYLKQETAVKELMLVWQKIKDAKVFLRKIQGKRATPIKNLPVDPDAPAPVSISASQQSYTQLVMHYAGLIDLVKSEVKYTPNETDLKPAALDAKYTELDTNNKDVLSAHTAVTKARTDRNKILYTPETGIVDNAKLVKTYVKGAFGASSVEFKKVSGIAFKVVK